MAPIEPINLARIALGRLGLVGKGGERDRRPTQDELERIIIGFEANERQQIPVGRIVRFAVATAMRQDEIVRVEWRDFDAESRMLLIRDRKDPRKKSGNDQRIPLLDVSGWRCRIQPWIRYDICARAAPWRVPPTTKLQSRLLQAEFSDHAPERSAKVLRLRR